jgi:hypothetical protein
VDGKAKASDALTTLGKVVADNAGLVDGKLGEKYGDYARSAARSIQETAAKLESKDLAELGDEAKSFVRKNPCWRWAWRQWPASLSPARSRDRPKRLRKTKPEPAGQMTGQDGARGSHDLARLSAEGRSNLHE